MSCKALHFTFFNNARTYPQSEALYFNGSRCTYGELSYLARRVSRTINNESNSVGACSHWIGILAGTNTLTYATVLGILNAGKGYLPLACDYPTTRIIDMVKRGEVTHLFVDEDAVSTLKGMLEHIDWPLNICIATVDGGRSDSIDALGREHRIHRYFDIDINPDSERNITDAVAFDLPAYLLFTSGSTGVPKGVMVSHGNARHFVDSIVTMYDFGSSDRFSQNFDLTFDLSVFDIFVCFEVGACLCPPTAGDKVLPKRYINRTNISVWFSVPSVVNAMQRSRQLGDGAFPRLRYSLFCGEALTAKAARLWQDAAPDSTLENLYGPTEATVACTSFALTDFDNEKDESVVPIGVAFPGLQTKILDENLQPVPAGETGELWVGGPQVALGYLNDPEQTKARFVADEKGKINFYRTGDRVFFDCKKNALCYIGRVDHQIKLMGYRIELAEVEKALRACNGGENAVAIALPPGGPYTDLKGVMEAVADENHNEEKAVARLRSLLPDYMMPSEIVFMAKLPLNHNGKIDREATLTSIFH